MHVLASERKRENERKREREKERERERVRFTNANVSQASNPNQTRRCWILKGTSFTGIGDLSFATNYDQKGT